MFGEAGGGVRGVFYYPGAKRINVSFRFSGVNSPSSVTPSFIHRAAPAPSHPAIIPGAGSGFLLFHSSCASRNGQLATFATFLVTFSFFQNLVFSVRFRVFLLIFEAFTSLHLVDVVADHHLNGALHHYLPDDATLSMAQLITYIFKSRLISIYRMRYPNSQRKQQLNNKIHAAILHMDEIAEGRMSNLRMTGPKSRGTFRAFFVFSLVTLERIAASGLDARE